jgi:hypothetical protein
LKVLVVTTTIVVTALREGAVEAVVKNGTDPVAGSAEEPVTPSTRVLLLSPIFVPKKLGL